MRASNYRKKLDKKVWRIIWGTVCGVVLCGIIFFFTYFHVTEVEVVESTHYSKKEIEEMVLTGPMASNSVLAPLLYSKDHVEGIPFVEKFDVLQVNHNTITVSVKEVEAVGCIPYLDCYVYFDREGIMIESSVERDEKIPYFDGINVDYVVNGKKLPIKGDTVLNTAVSLARIFEKNESIPDHISFDENYQISLQYGDITVELGQDEYLEEKMEKVIAILPLIQGQKGILHLENVDENMQKVTFESTEESEEDSEDSQTEDETSDDTAADDGSYDSYDDSSYDDGSYDSYGDGSYDDGSYDSYGDGSYDDGSYDSYGDGSYDGGSYDSYGDGSYDDGSYDSYGDGSYDDGSYDSYGDGSYDGSYDSYGGSYDNGSYGSYSGY